MSAFGRKLPVTGYVKPGTLISYLNTLVLVVNRKLKLIPLKKPGTEKQKHDTLNNQYN